MPSSILRISDLILIVAQKPRVNLIVTSGPRELRGYSLSPIYFSFTRHLPSTSIVDNDQVNLTTIPLASLADDKRNVFLAPSSAIRSSRHLFCGGNETAGCGGGLFS